MQKSQMQFCSIFYRNEYDWNLYLPQRISLEIKIKHKIFTF